MKDDSVGIYATIIVYTLTFAGLNFRKSQILAIFVFLFSQMQGLAWSLIHRLDVSFESLS